MSDRKINIYFTDGLNPPRVLNISEYTPQLVGTPDPPVIEAYVLADLLYVYWEGVTYGLYYEVFVNGEKVADKLSDLFYIDNEAEEGTYIIKVRAYSGTNDFSDSLASLFSNVLTFDISYIPKNLQFADNIVSWDSLATEEVEDEYRIEGAAGYNVYVDAVKHNTSLVTTNEYSLSGLSSGSYDIFVTAVYSIDGELIEYPASEIISISVSPASPTNLAVSTTEDTVFTWDSVSGVDGYNLYLNKDGGGYTKHNSSPIAVNSYTITDLVDGNYEAYVTSVANGLESPASNVVEFTIGPIDYDSATFMHDSFGTPGTSEEDSLYRWNGVGRTEMVIGSRTVGAMDFPAGDADAFLLPNVSKLSPTSGVNLYSVWINWESNGYASDIVGTWRGVTDPKQFLFRVTEAGALNLFVIDNNGNQIGSANGSSSVPAGTTAHVVAEINLNTNEIAVWVNNLRGTPVAITGMAADPGYGIMIGRRDHNPSSGSFSNRARFQGKMSQLVAVNSATADVAATVSALYGGGTPPEFTALSEGVRDTITAGYDHAGALVRGVWTWYNDPRGIRIGDITYIGYINASGQVKVSSYDHANKVWAESPVIDTLSVDDHSNPSLLLKTDGKIAAYYAGHLGPLKVSETDVTGDVTTFGTPVDVVSTDTSYARPVQLAGESDAIYMFYRAGGATAPRSFVKSTDGGATWSTPVTYIENTGERPYVKIAQNGDSRIDFFFGDGHPRDVTNNLYHFYYEGGNYYKSDGTLIGDATALPVTPADATVVWDAAANGGENSWIWEAMSLNDGTPVAAFATFPSLTDHKYRVARWTGSAWETSEVTSAGRSLYDSDGVEDHYSGGITLVSDTEVICSREAANGSFELWRYTTNDFITWTGEQITTGSENPSPSIATNQKNFRPYAIKNINSALPFSLLWCRGRYTTYTDYDIDIMLGAAIPQVSP